MEIYATLRHKMDIDPLDVIEKLKTEFLGDHGRWIEKEGHKFCIMRDCYHNSTEVVREISAEEMVYFDSLTIIQNYLKK